MRLQQILEYNFLDTCVKIVKRLTNKTGKETIFYKTMDVPILLYDDLRDPVVQCYMSQAESIQHTDTYDADDILVWVKGLQCVIQNFNEEQRKLSPDKVHFIIYIGSIQSKAVHPLPNATAVYLLP